mmetsp:Transcript_50926/g.164861  ORF Transcript_50926/g.164861 Transcript_50926/m.164861 type:complete len:230 (+) Transcript_50926:172-861(+)
MGRTRSWRAVQDPLALLHLSRTSARDAREAQGFTEATPSTFRSRHQATMSPAFQGWRPAERRNAAPDRRERSHPSTGPAKCPLGSRSAVPCPRRRSPARRRVLLSQAPELGAQARDAPVAPRRPGAGPWAQPGASRRVAGHRQADRRLAARMELAVRGEPTDHRQPAGCGSAIDLATDGILREAAPCGPRRKASSAQSRWHGSPGVPIPAATTAASQDDALPASPPCSL